MISEIMLCNLYVHEHVCKLLNKGSVIKKIKNNLTPCYTILGEARGKVFAKYDVNQVFFLMEYSYGSLTKSNYKCPWEVLNRTLACYDRNKCHLWLIKWCDLFLVCFSLSSISITFSPVSAYKRLGSGYLRNIIFFFFNFLNN